MRIVSALKAATLLAFVLCAAPAAAGELRASGKLLLTGGVSALEGAAGGGLATWAVIGGQETRDGIGATVHATEVRVSDFELRSVGAAVGLFDRLELSYARQRFDTLDAGAALGLGQGYAIDQDVFGAKARLWGNLVYDQDTWVPQVSAGVQYKRNDRTDLVRALGAASSDGVDYYVAASKLFLAQSLLLNATVRATRANQTGILGFGGDRDRDYSAQLEGSAAYLLSRRLVVGAEVRTKPDNLGFAHEGDAYDLFAAYAFNKAVSLTVAYVDLGAVATFTHQRGVYALSPGRVLTMKAALLAPFLLTLAVAPAARGADAAPAPASNAGATPVAGAAVFARFHGKAGVDRIVADLIAHARTDPRISDIFKASDLARLQTQLSDQLCFILGGGCVYGGKDMAKAHKDLGLQDADLNALVEDLQRAMDREGVPFPAQNVLLAKLAPMRRVVVVR